MNYVYFLAFLETLLARLAIGFAGAGLPEALASFRACKNRNESFAIEQEKNEFEVKIMPLKWQLPWP